jgi:hypothetical protein
MTLTKTGPGESQNAVMPQGRAAGSSALRFSGARPAVQHGQTAPELDAPVPRGPRVLTFTEALQNAAGSGTLFPLRPASRLSYPG